MNHLIDLYSFWDLFDLIKINKNLFVLFIWFCNIWNRERTIKTQHAFATKKSRLNNKNVFCYFYSGENSVGV